MLFFSFLLVLSWHPVACTRYAIYVSVNVIVWMGDVAGSSASRIALAGDTHRHIVHSLRSYALLCCRIVRVEVLLRKNSRVCNRIHKFIIYIWCDCCCVHSALAFVLFMTRRQQYVAIAGRPTVGNSTLALGSCNITIQMNKSQRLSFAEEFFFGILMSSPSSPSPPAYACDYIMWAVLE